MVRRLRPRRGAPAARGAPALSADPRSRRVAVVADEQLGDAGERFGAAGYGLIQLPPVELPASARSAWIEQVAEHVAEFARTGYEVVLAAGDADADALARALAPLGAPPPERRSAP